MDQKDILNGVYEDFFGALSKKPAEIQKQVSSEMELNNENITNFEEEIENLQIDDKSKETLKNIFEYVKKYNEKVEKQKISFNMCLYIDNDETINSILNLINCMFNKYSYMPEGEVKRNSFFDIENSKDIDERYNSKNNIITFENFDAFDSKAQSDKEKFIFKLSEKIEEKREICITVLVAKNKDEIKNLFISSDKIKNEFSNFEIIGKNPDVQDIYQYVLNKLEENMIVDDELKIKLLDYISKTYPETSMTYTKYREDLCEKIIFNKQVPEYERDKSIDEIFEEINQLVGLKKVKSILKELVSLIELKNKAKDDLKINNVNLHMVFLGNPGTGKTTVARIVAEILYNLKYIRQNKLIEVSSKDLVAEYVGQTAPKTNAVIQKAMGGVLFVDEAYTLASGAGQKNSYNEEAIATLIQAMENYRNDLVIIFAGYTKEMQDFLNTNSGIVSRIGYSVEFDDYSVDELTKIFMQMMHKSGFIVSKEAESKVKEIIEEYKNKPNFGNARFARNLYEKSILKHASNTQQLKDKKSLKTIKKEDISLTNIGF